jgi:hypothetical protein
MKTLRLLAAALLLTLAAGHSARALEAYPSNLTGQFMDWCTGKAGSTETACTCALKRLAQTVPAAALTTFVADKTGGGSGFSMSTATVATAALVTDALTACVK